MSRGRLTMRADLERNTEAAKDDYGHPATPVFSVIGRIATWVYSKARREITDGDKLTVVEDVRAMFSQNADVQQGDEISNIRDRLGQIIMAGRYRIETIQRKRRHQEAGLLKVMS